MSNKELENYINEAILALPERIRKALSNVAFVIEDEPPKRDLLGLYHGIPLTERGRGYNMVLPDKITIYRKMIEAESDSSTTVSAIVRRVVWHEIGHHLGFGEKEIRKLEKKWEKQRKV